MNQPFHLINVGWGYGKPYLVAEIRGIFAGHHTVPRGISDEFTRLHFRRDNPSLVSKRTNKYSMEPSLNGSKVLQEPHDKRLLTIFSPYERLILIFINILNVLLLANLLLNRSTVPEVFGRYTRSYAIGVLICLIIAGGVLVFSLNRLQAPSRNPLHALLRYPAIAWALLVIISIGGASIFPAGDQIKTFVLLDAAVAGLYIAIMDTRVAPLASLTKRRFMVLSSVLLLIILVLNLGAITSIPGEQSAGDEADWASFAVNWMRTGNVATWISNEPQLPIVPGVGYGVSLLGRWFQRMGVGFVQGRLLVWIFFALGVGSVGIAAWQLFDVPIALMCMIVAASSRAFLNHRFIRPEVALPFIAALAFATYIASKKKPMWGFLCGWLCILSLESHAAGAAYFFSLTANYPTAPLQDWHQGTNPLWNMLYRPLQNKNFTFALGI